MAHQRKLIRDAVVERLIEADTVAGKRVFPSRVVPLGIRELPGILVYANEEPAEISNEAPREFKRSLELVLELVLTAEREESLDDLVDDFCEQVETAIFSDAFFGSLVTDTFLVHTQLGIWREGEKPIGAAKITLSMPYFQQLPGDLTEDLDDLETIGTTYTPPESTPTTPETEDLIDVSED